MLVGAPAEQRRHQPRQQRLDRFARQRRQLNLDQDHRGSHHLLLAVAEERQHRLEEAQRDGREARRGAVLVHEARQGEQRRGHHVRRLAREAGAHRHHHPLQRLLPPSIARPARRLGALGDEQQRVEGGGARLDIRLLCRQHHLAQHRRHRAAQLLRRQPAHKRLEADEPPPLARGVARGQRLVKGGRDVRQPLGEEGRVVLGQRAERLVGLLLQQRAVVRQQRPHRPPEEGRVLRGGEGGREREQQVEERALLLERIGRGARGRRLEQLAQHVAEKVGEERRRRRVRVRADRLADGLALLRGLRLVQVEEQRQKILGVLADGLERRRRCRGWPHLDAAAAAGRHDLAQRPLVLHHRREPLEDGRAQLGPLVEHGAERLGERGEGGRHVVGTRAEAGEQRPDLLVQVVQVLLLDRPPVGAERRGALEQPRLERDEVRREEVERRASHVASQHGEQPRGVLAAVARRHLDRQPLDKGARPNGARREPE
mmetsp:Transcript_11566/g.37060  ORF Transcript_11566/g.37060 Transcript_11566/m.37060 type:complete len:487 (-) Transcript_11566:1390-2850(-)